MSLAAAVKTLRQYASDRADEKLAKRMQRMDLPSLIQWTETTAVGVGAAFGDWQLKRDPASLAEARLGTATLLFALEELQRRDSA